MALIKDNGIATAMMALRNPKIVTPIDIASRSECTDFFLCEDNYVTSSAGVVDRIENIADPGRYASQGTGVNKPAMASDAVLGRDTMTFNADQLRRLQVNGSTSHTGPHSYVCVFKSPQETSAYDQIFGTMGVAPQQSALVVRENAVQARVGDGACGDSGNYTAGKWAVAWLFYNGTNQVGCAINNDAIVTGVVTSEPTVTTLYLGGNTGFGYRGSLAMAARFNVDLRTEADLLTDIKRLINYKFSYQLGYQFAMPEFSSLDALRGLIPPSLDWGSIFNPWDTSSDYGSVASAAFGRKDWGLL